MDPSAARDQEDQEIVRKLNAIYAGELQEDDLNGTRVTKRDKMWSFGPVDGALRSQFPCVFKARRSSPSAVERDVLVIQRSCGTGFYWIGKGHPGQSPQHMSNDQLIWDWRGPTA